VKAGRLWEDLLAQVAQNEMGWFWEAELLPNTPEARYLSTVMARHEFHEAIKNLRDLKFLINKVERWQAELPAVDSMLALRRETYQSQLTRLTPEQTLDKVLDVRTTRDIYAKELAQIEADEDAFALATEKEQKLQQRLAWMEERIWRLSSQPGPHTRRLAGFRDRYRFYKGLLDYDILTTYPIRRWEVRKSLKSLDADLAQTLEQQNSLQKARANAPLDFDGYALRIQRMGATMAILHGQLQTTFDEQKALLQKMVDVELDKLRTHLVDYLDQARFSLAHVQDMATDAADSGKELK
jgi:hypothetical protein